MALNTTIALLILSSNASQIFNETEPYPQMVNKTLLIEVVSSLYRLHEFHNIVFYISERLVMDTHMAAEFFHNFWEAFPTAPTIIMGNNALPMRGFLSTPSLCLVLTTERDDPIMELASLSLKGVRFFKTIFVFFPIVETDDFYHSFEEYKQFYESIRLIYEWVWKKQFTNTALITVRNNVFQFDPYPTPNIINITEEWTAKSLFVRSSGDFKGYVISTPVRYDLPRVFYMTQQRRGIKKTEPVSGLSGKLFTSFMESINATFNETLTDSQKVEPVDINQIINMVEQKQLEISIHSYTGMFNSNVGTSYPIGINDWCIMVPYRNRSPEHSYLQKSFQLYTWYLICFSVIYITVGIWLCSPYRNRDLSLSFLQAICSTLSIVPLRLLMLPNGRVRFIFVLLFIMGFVTTNFYTSKMASFLTASTDQPQINTVQDVINTKLHIMVMTFEYDILLSYDFPQSFINLLVVASKTEMDKHRDRFNTSFGYSVQSDRWNFLSTQQRYLKKPLFRLSEICIGPFYHVFPVQKDSHLSSPLQSFIMSASQVGLLTYWRKEAFADALYLGYVRMIMVNESLLPLSISFFRSVWYVWWLGLMISGLIFCLEIKGVTWRKAKDVCGNCLQRLCNEIYEI